MRNIRCLLFGHDYGYWFHHEPADNEESARAARCVRENCGKHIRQGIVVTDTSGDGGKGD